MSAATGSVSATLSVACVASLRSTPVRPQLVAQPQHASSGHAGRPSVCRGAARRSAKLRVLHPPCAVPEDGSQRGGGETPGGEGRDHTTSPSPQTSPPPPSELDGRPGDVSEAGTAGGNPLAGVNPVELGRKSRAFVDNVWQRVLSLGSTSVTAGLADELLGLERRALYNAAEGEGGNEGSGTTVLVVGATGRVGTILVRKLALRGYTVRALVRSAAAADGCVLPAGCSHVACPTHTHAHRLATHSLPTGVQVVEGDVGDAEAVARAVHGCSKVVMCARARSDISSDVTNVERTGVGNLIKALLDGQNSAAVAAKQRRGERNKITLFKFKGEHTMEGWAQDATTEQGAQQGASGTQGFRRVGLVKEAASTLAASAEEGELDWSGYVFGRGDAQISGPLQGVQPRELATCDGLVLRCLGDGKRYSCVLKTVSGDGTAHWYAASFPTRMAWQPVRLPFNDFRPLEVDAPPLDPGAITRLGFRFEMRAQPKKAGTPLGDTAAAAPSRGKAAARGKGAFDPDEEFRALLAAQQTSGVTAAPEPDTSNNFRLCVAMVKALPGGGEPDFVLVSCAGAGLEAEEAEKVVAAKRQGEALLKNSGLGYTILRPGNLLEAPGGYKALVFDQGGRISEGITCADVADVCVQALHDGEARNRSFDVCHEYTPAAGESRFELLAHLPGKSGSYLTTGLKGLAKNT